MDNHQRLRILLVGCGAVAKQFHVPALKHLQSTVEVVRVVDTNPTSAAAIAREFTNCTSGTTLGDIGSHLIDLAIVASPPGLHCEHSIALLNKGVDVLCEKPIATHVSDAIKMTDAALAANRLLAIGHIRRFFPACQAIADILDHRLLGRVLSYSISEAEQFAWPLQSASLFKPELSGGGILADLGVHVLDLILWWFGTPSIGPYFDDAAGGVEASCRFSVKHEDNVTGEVWLSRDWGYKSRYLIDCEKGRIVWYPGLLDGFELILQPDSRRIVCQSVGAVTTSSRRATYVSCMVSQLKNVLGAVSDKRQLVMPGSEAIKSLQLIDHCYANKLVLEMPWLTEEEKHFLASGVNH